MSKVEKLSVALTSEQASALREAVEAGEYATTSEIVREAVREWQLKRKLARDEVNLLRRRWDEGVRSGKPRPVNFDDLRRDGKGRLSTATKAGRLGR